MVQIKVVLSDILSRFKDSFFGSFKKIVFQAQIKQLNLTKLVRKEHFTVVKKVDLNMVKCELENIKKSDKLLYFQFPTSLIPTTIIADCSNPIQKQCLCFIFYNIDRISTINASMKLQKCAFVPTESTVVDIKFSCFWHETLSQVANKTKFKSRLFSF